MSVKTIKIFLSFFLAFAFFLFSFSFVFALPAVVISYPTVGEGGTVVWYNISMGNHSNSTDYWAGLLAPMEAWNITYNATYHAYNSTGLIKDWNSTGFLINWNSSGLIINWSGEIGGEPLWQGNSTLVVYIGDANKTKVYCGNITGAASDLCTITSGSGNSSWNQSLADTLYYQQSQNISAENITKTSGTNYLNYALDWIIDTLYDLIGTKASPGTCPEGQVAQNTTTSGVQCITPPAGSETDPLWTGNATLVAYQSDLAYYINNTLLANNLANYMNMTNFSVQLDNITIVRATNTSFLDIYVTNRITGYINNTQLANNLVNYINNTILANNLVNYMNMSNFSTQFDNVTIVRATNTTFLDIYVTNRITGYVNETSLANNLVNYINNTKFATIGNWTAGLSNLSKSNCSGTDKMIGIYLHNTSIVCAADQTGGGGSYIQTTTCSGNDKVSAVNNVTGVVTCSIVSTYNVSYVPQEAWNSTYNASYVPQEAWNSTYNATYDAYNSTGLIKDYNASGFILNWNSSGLVIDWNVTGFIINWSSVITGGDNTSWNQSLADTLYRTLTNNTFVGNITADGLITSRIETNESDMTIENTKGGGEVYIKTNVGRADEGVYSFAGDFLANTGGAFYWENLAGTVGFALKPAINACYAYPTDSIDLGTTIYKWRNLYLSGNLTTTNLNVSDTASFSKINTTGNISASWFKGTYDWIISTASSLWLSFTGTELSFNETNLNITINKSIDARVVYQEAWNSTYNASYVPQDAWNWTYNVTYDTWVKGSYNKSLNITSSNFTVDTDINIKGYSIFNATNLNVTNINASTIRATEINTSRLNITNSGNITLGNATIYWNGTALIIKVT